VATRRISPGDRRHLLDVRVGPERAHDPFLQCLVERTRDLGMRGRDAFERAVEILELDPIFTAAGDANAARHMCERALQPFDLLCEAERLITRTDPSCETLAGLLGDLLRGPR